MYSNSLCFFHAALFKFDDSQTHSSLIVLTNSITAHWKLSFKLSDVVLGLNPHTLQNGLVLFVVFPQEPSTLYDQIRTQRE